jgi:Polyketide cyclase / dehydrase and lipid transport
MFEFTESISILAPPPAVWEFLRDVEGWWPASNPEHDSIERLDDRDVLEVGAQLRILEKVASIPGVATGTITRFAPGSAITWEAPEARYKWFGLSFTVGEGVTWRVEPRDDDKSAIVSADVWATFPPGGGADSWSLAFACWAGSRRTANTPASSCGISSASSKHSRASTGRRARFVAYPRRV